MIEKIEYLQSEASTQNIDDSSTLDDGADTEIIIQQSSSSEDDNHSQGNEEVVFYHPSKNGEDHQRHYESVITWSDPEDDRHYGYCYPFLYYKGEPLCLLGPDCKFS